MELIDKQAAIDAIRRDPMGGLNYRRILSDMSTESRWIPCSERLPDEFGEYLVTKKAIGWNCEEYNSNDIAYFDNEGFHKAKGVLAWMPLPEPYEERREADDH